MKHRDTETQSFYFFERTEFTNKKSGSVTFWLLYFISPCLCVSVFHFTTTLAYERKTDYY